MSKEQMLREVEKMNNIINTGELWIETEKLDISTALGLYTSKEYRRDDIDDIDITKYSKSEKACKFTVLTDGSDNVMFNKRYKTEDKRFLQKKICVLNFASGKNPGGGYIRGCMAQEEALCQASNLYYILKKHTDYFEYNRNNLCKGQYSDGVIFTKNCLFFRNKYKNVKPQLVDVITCPAPNFKVARRNGVSKEEIECTMSRRIEQILKVAIANNVRILALGAFGCGVFHNDPYKVASIMHTILDIRGYSEYFDEIIFPMNGNYGSNVDAFVKEFGNFSE